jgi:hypothetical protein
MSTSSFASVELAIVTLLRSVLPSGVEITTLSPAQAGKLKLKPGRPGRVNVAFVRIELEQSLRNVPARPDSPRATPPKPVFGLSYLISAYAGLDATKEGGVPHLLECALRAFFRQPVQTVAVTDSAGVTTQTQITLLIQELTFDQLTGLWSALQTELQPSVVCLARPVPIG